MAIEISEIPFVAFLFELPRANQFKLAECWSRSNATYISDGTYTSPYFRISLHHRDNNRQHRLFARLTALLVASKFMGMFVPPDSPERASALRRVLICIRVSNVIFSSSEPKRPKRSRSTASRAESRNQAALMTNYPKSSGH
jgi:hypothetical protein